ncbi:competence protein ComG [Lysinibacillus sphaericus]|uniref:competence type IV pilus minor pilin ComGD n=1 Tax=Lysinibacillus sphaericus TaxID=1421 RepID=UPI0018CD3853|nr:competence type IV pilus minor pilin ComGD [Lysinibacillus sphaericus]MBG9455861.1 competence protein ComG [Lysinibacillus sphaericus]MBG9479701.1 competence protein ComG [Lysinibacillus sphaericus]MBG9594434.1 competence protein ComG [Lysinibacillus sphaericus]
MYVNKSERGYTFVEMLIVLFIVMCLSAIVVKYSLKAAETRELEQFFTQIQLDIQYIQTYSMHQREYISMKFESSSKRYIIKKDIFTELYERPFPKGVEFMPASSSIYTIMYNYNGNIMTPGTVYFKTPQGIKKVVITLGRGRSRIE